MADKKTKDSEFNRNKALAEMFNTGQLYSKMYEHISKNVAYNNVEFAEVCKDFSDFVFDEFLADTVLPKILPKMTEDADEEVDFYDLPGTFTYGGVEFYKNPVIDYAIIPTFINVIPSKGRITEKTKWKRETGTIKQWREAEEAKIFKIKEKLETALKKATKVQPAILQKMAVYEKPKEVVKPEVKELEEVIETTNVKKEKKEPKDKKEIEPYDKLQAISELFNKGARAIVSYYMIEFNLPTVKDQRDVVESVCKKMRRLYEENFIEPCLGVFGLPKTKEGFVNIVTKGIFLFDLHPVVSLDYVCENFNVHPEYIDGTTWRFIPDRGYTTDPPEDIQEWVDHQMKQYYGDFDTAVLELKQNGVNILMIDAEGSESDEE
jgi:hypothetical protein